MNRTKTILLAVAAAAICSSARANLIDVTPGGFTFDNWSPVVSRFYNNYHPILDVFAPGPPVNGWVNFWTDLGGTALKTSLRDTAAPVATLSWDFRQSGLVVKDQGTGAFIHPLMGWIILAGTTEDGTNWFHAYQTRDKDSQFGTAEITLDGNAGINYITVYGRRSASVPDTGNTVALMGMAMAGLAWARRRA